jgi:predicted transcriptional regulator YheO
MPANKIPVQRVQVGVRLEQRMVKVLKGLAEFNGETLGQLMEKIVLHSFTPAEGDEGELSASPHSKRELEVIGDLKRIYGMDFDAHTARSFADDVKQGSEPSSD